MSKFGLLVAVGSALGLWLSACSLTPEQPIVPDSGSGNGGVGAGAREGSGGAAGSAGGAAGSASGTGGNATGGTSGASTGGSAGNAGSAGSAGFSGSAGSSGSTGDPGNGWTQIWSDEFDGTAIDSSKWQHEVDCNGGGNGEDQCYVSAAKNSFVEGGSLHIVALKDRPSGAISPSNPRVVTKNHSSARLRTLGRGDWKYGRMEMRAKLPFGKGLWPAFWMLPTDRTYGGWAASGEIDILEAINLKPGANEIHGTLHYGGSWPNNVHTGTSYRPPSNVWEQFHLYAIEWEEGEVRWFVDQKHYATQTEWRSTAAPFPAPFNQRFHLILNVAVGGQWPGPPDGTTTFPQVMMVDYVRVYACSLDRAAGHGCGTRDPAIRPL